MRSVALLAVGLREHTRYDGFRRDCLALALAVCLDVKAVGVGTCACRGGE